jgi:hypothetical protein
VAFLDEILIEALDEANGTLYVDGSLHEQFI